MNELGNSRQPWLFMSFIFSKTSLDFSFSDILQAKRWFYGLKNYMVSTKRGYKMLSYSGYTLRVIKLLMNEELEKEERGSFVQSLLAFNKNIEKL